MNIWHDVATKRITNEEFIACIEISKGSKMKYELDKETGRLVLDRVLYTSTHYPNNYGFISKTLSGDGDPLDVLFMCQEPILPLVLVKAYPIGVVKIIDSNEIDIQNFPKHILDEIIHFFKVYKQLENKETYVREILGAREVRKVIKYSIELYKETFPDK